MKAETLFERPRIEGSGDALKHSLRSFGAKARDAGLASLGFNKARGRLSIRKITDKLYKDFMAYVGGHDIHPVTDDTVRDYISRYYSQQLDAVEPTIQQIAGGGPPQQGTQPQPGDQPPPDETEFDQYTQGTGASDRRQGGDRRQPPPNGNPQSPSGVPPTAPTNSVANIASTRQSTPEEMARYQKLLALVNRSVMNPTPDPQFMNRIAALLKSASGSNNLRQYAKQKIDELKARPDVTQRYPELANIGDDPFANLPRAAAPAAPPAQPTTPTTPVATAGQTAPPPDPVQASTVPASAPAAQTPAAATGGWRQTRPGEVFPPGGRYRMNQTTGQSEVYEPEQAASAAPTAPDTTFDQHTQGTNATAAPAQPGETVEQSVSQIGPILSKPTITPQEHWWVMAAVNNALQKTQRGTPQRQQVVAALRALQNDPQAVAKVPQLKQIPLESHQRVFDLAMFLVENQITDKTALHEAYCRIMLEATALNRSQIDQIFKVLARNLNTSGMAYTQRGGKGGNQQTAQGQSKQTWGSSDKDPQRMMTTTITPQALQSAKKYVNINPQDYQRLVQAAGQNGEKLQQILRSLKNKTTDEMVELLIHAAGNP